MFKKQIWIYFFLLFPFFAHSQSASNSIFSEKSKLSNQFCLLRIQKIKQYNKLSCSWACAEMFLKSKGLNVDQCDIFRTVFQNPSKNCDLLGTNSLEAVQKKILPLFGFESQIKSLKNTNWNMIKSEILENGAFFISIDYQHLKKSNDPFHQVLGVGYQEIINHQESIRYILINDPYVFGNKNMIKLRYWKNTNIKGENPYAFLLNLKKMNKQKKSIEKPKLMYENTRYATEINQQISFNYFFSKSQTRYEATEICYNYLLSSQTKKQNCGVYDVNYRSTDKIVTRMQTDSVKKVLEPIAIFEQKRNKDFFSFENKKYFLENNKININIKHILNIPYKIIVFPPLAHEYYYFNINGNNYYRPINCAYDLFKDNTNPDRIYEEKEFLVILNQFFNNLTKTTLCNSF